MTVKRQPVPRRLVIVEVAIDEVPEEASLEYEPYTILQNKIEALMELTGGTERDCERMILEML
jgi:hypothetical protein